MRSFSGLAISSFWSLRILIGILFGPKALLSLKFCIMSSISSIVVGARKKEFSFELKRYDEKDFCVGGILSTKLLAMEVKNYENDLLFLVHL